MIVATALMGVLGAFEVGGTSTCPSPEDVSTRLFALAPGAADPRLKLSATLTQLEGGVGVQLRGADGEVVAERQLAGGSACDELAAATSVMLVAWAREYEQQGAAPPPMPERDLEGADPPSDLKDATRSLITLDVQIGLSASLAGGDLAIGGLVGAAVTPMGSRFGGGLGLLVLGARPGVGAAGTWERFALAAGPHYRFDFSWAALDVHTEALAGVLYAVPEERSASQVTFDAGASGGVRLLGKAGFFAEARAAGWPAPRTFPGGGPLPHFEVLFAAGLAWSSP